MNTTVPKNEMKTPQQNNSEQELELNLYDLFHGVIKFWWLCLSLAALGAAVMFVNSFVFFKPVYAASATFTVQTQNNTSSAATNDNLTSYSFSYNKTTAAQLSQTFPKVIETNILQDIILNDLGISEMPATLTAAAVSDTNMFTITASGNDPKLTYDVIVSTITNYPAVAEYVFGNTNLTVLNEPVIPTTPSNRNDYKTHMLIGAFVGLLLSGVWIVLYVMFRQTIRSRREVREKLNQHCIAVLPHVVFKKYKNKVNRSVLINNPKVGDGYLESFRALRNSLVNSLVDDQKVIMISSTAPGEGKSTISANLAISLGKMDKSVLLIDADLRNPSVNSILGVDLPADRSSQHPAKIDKLPQHGISVLNFNTDDFDIWKIIRVDALKNLIEKLRETYDYIIVDTPPVGITSDPTVIAQVCDAAVLVIREDTVRVSRITNSINTLLYSEVNLVGCILNSADTGFSSYGGKYGRYGYGYGYGYGKGYGDGYGYGESKSEKKSERKKHPSSGTHEPEKSIVT